jgi:hypothetical protein
MSVIFLKDEYIKFVESDRTTLEDLLREHTRIDNILAEFESPMDGNLLEELELELGDILEMLEEAISECREAQRIAEENYKYELNFKPNR